MSCFGLCLGKVPLVLSVTELLQVCFDLNLDIHIETVIVLLKLSCICQGCLFIFELRNEFETVIRVKRDFTLVIQIVGLCRS